MNDYASRRVAGPALGLIVTSSLCGLLLLVSLAFNAWLLLSGAVNDLTPPPGMTKEAQVLIRAGWGLLMLAANVLILVGAIRLKRLRSPALAKTACVVAMIPCLGPCFVFGIPFGVWGLVVLGDPRVQAGFEK